MRRGQAPKAPSAHQMPWSTILHLRHIDPEGPIYDVDNMRVVSPLRHYQNVHPNGALGPRGTSPTDTSLLRGKLTANLASLRKLPHDDIGRAEVRRRIDEFEANAPYPYATDLIVLWPHEFKTMTELVDFAFGQDKAETLSRKDLVAVTRRLMTADVANAVQSERLSIQFKANVTHPEGDGLIFHPQI